MLDWLSDAAEIPVPDNATDWGLPGAVSVNRRLAVFAPRLVGRNRTVTLHDPSAATAPVQVLPTVAKLAASAPMTETSLTVTAFGPGFFRTSVRDALSSPTTVDGKATSRGLRSRPVALSRTERLAE